MVIPRAGEPANVLAAPAPHFFFHGAPAPDFFPKRLRLQGAKKNRLRLLNIDLVWLNILFPAN